MSVSDHATPREFSTSSTSSQPEIAIIQSPHNEISQSEFHERPINHPLQSDRSDENNEEEHDVGDRPEDILAEYDIREVAESREIWSSDDDHSYEGESYEEESFTRPDVSLELIEHNYNERFENIGSPPPWYILTPAAVDHDDGMDLCGTCCRINFEFLFDPNEADKLPPAHAAISLGPIEDIFDKGLNCGFCKFVGQIICLELCQRNLPRGFTDTEMWEQFAEYLNTNFDDEYFLYSCALKETNSFPMLFLGSGTPDPLSLGHTTVSRPNLRLGIRELFIRQREVRTGRFIEELDKIDVPWIKEQIALCDERSIDASTSLAITIRAIDVHSMSIVYISPGERYVTLSYVW
jgi:hypothetical protein